MPVRSFGQSRARLRISNTRRRSAPRCPENPQGSATCRVFMPDRAIAACPHGQPASRIPAARVQLPRLQPPLTFLVGTTGCRLAGRRFGRAGTGARRKRSAQAFRGASGDGDPPDRHPLSQQNRTSAAAIHARCIPHAARTTRSNHTVERHCMLHIASTGQCDTGPPPLDSACHVFT